jgi:hypothetical protein
MSELDIFLVTLVTAATIWVAQSAHWNRRRDAKH